MACTPSQADGFRFQIRLESDPTHRIKQILVDDIEAFTVDDLRNRAVALTFPDASTNPSNYETTLKYNGVLEEWWIDIQTDFDLKCAVKDNKNQGYAMISAVVVKKGAPPVAPPITAMLATPTTPNAVMRTSSIAAAPCLTVATVSPVAARKAKPKVAKKRSSAKKSTPKTKKSAARNKKSISKFDERPVEQRIIDTLVQFYGVNVHCPQLELVANWSGYSNPKSDTFTKALKECKERQHVECRKKGTLSITKLGIENSSLAITPAASNEDMHRRIKALLEPKAIEMFELLGDGSLQERKSLATAMNYSNEKSATFTTSIASLTSLGFAEYIKSENDPKLKQIQLTALAFPFGRGPAPRLSAVTTQQRIEPPAMDQEGGEMLQDNEQSHALVGIADERAKSEEVAAVMLNTKPIAPGRAVQAEPEYPHDVPPTIEAGDVLLEENGSFPSLMLGVPEDQNEVSRETNVEDMAPSGENQSNHKDQQVVPPPIDEGSEPVQESDQSNSLVAVAEKGKKRNMVKKEDTARPSGKQRVSGRAVKANPRYQQYVDPFAIEQDLGQENAKSHALPKKPKKRIKVKSEEGAAIPIPDIKPRTTSGRSIKANPKYL